MNSTTLCSTGVNCSDYLKIVASEANVSISVRYEGNGQSNYIINHAGDFLLLESSFTIFLFFDFDLRSSLSYASQQFIGTYSARPGGNRSHFPMNLFILASADSYKRQPSSSNFSVRKLPSKFMRVVTSSPVLVLQITQGTVPDLDVSASLVVPPPQWLHEDRLLVPSLGLEVYLLMVSDSMSILPDDVLVDDSNTSMVAVNETNASYYRGSVLAPSDYITINVSGGYNVSGQLHGIGDKMATFFPLAFSLHLINEIAGKPVDLNIIQVYAPTANSNDEDLDKFYNELDTAKTQCKFQDPLIIMGDFNAKVGTEKVDDTLGKHGLGIRNERGEKLIEWCQTNNIIVGNMVSTTSKEKMDMEKPW
ncbi:craniofacial development protein 2-like [Plakobranchus ocellatus]|uniref:Craniofacial development protein 2-like n=1 Tax=Plakobranchus ocellatus TaxID=259542 RepID=A0AAV4DTI5_9GAST|nr:craniofacial development protein 2-like [Plakobranchus ocellatus]